MFREWWDISRGCSDGHVYVCMVGRRRRKGWKESQGQEDLRAQSEPLNTRLQAFPYFAVSEQPLRKFGVGVCAPEGQTRTHGVDIEAKVDGHLW